MEKLKKIGLGVEFRLHSVKNETLDRGMLSIKTNHNAEAVLRNVWPENMHHKESFFALFLNRSNQLLGYSMINSGCAGCSAVDVKELLALSIMIPGCVALIVAHNHPGGSKEPSVADRNVTKAIQSLLNYLAIDLLDHLILLPEKGSVSMRELGLVRPIHSETAPSPG